MITGYENHKGRLWRFIIINCSSFYHLFFYYKKWNKVAINKWLNIWLQLCNITLTYRTQRQYQQCEMKLQLINDWIFDYIYTT